MTLVPGQWAALTMPKANHGITGGSKHVTGAVNSENGRIYFAGGDYGGGLTSSYQQTIWSLNLAERLADSANATAGWYLEYPYCGPPEQIQPKHPDFMTWQWDPTRSLFWLTAGLWVAAANPANCPGETPTNAPDPMFPHHGVLSFDPHTKTWRMYDPQTQPALSSSSTWQGIYDPQTDRLFKFFSGKTLFAVEYDFKAKTWAKWALPLGSNGKPIHLETEALAFDPKARLIYSVDKFTAHLYAYHMDARTMQDLGAVPVTWPPPPSPSNPPGTPKATMNQVAFDTRRGLLVFGDTYTWTTWVYNPAAKNWTALSTTTSNGVAEKPRGRTIVYDPGVDAFVLFGDTWGQNMYMFVLRLPESPA